MLDPQATARATLWVAAVVGLALALLVGGFRWEAFPMVQYEARPSLPHANHEPSVERAVFANDQLWLLTSSGEIWSAQERAPGAAMTPTPEPAIGLCAAGDAVVAVTADQGTPTTYTARRRQASGWSVIGAVPARGEGLVGVHCAADEVVLITARRLVTLRANGSRTLELSHRIPSWPVSALHLTPTHVFVGLNAGEWGGGLQRIDRTTGQVVIIARNAKGDLCGGPLNTDCDPVTGIAQEPGKPDCIVAAIGLIHMMSRGRLVEVCGERVRLLYQPRCPGSTPTPGEGDWFCSTAFFGLGRREDTLVALGVDGLHMIKGEVATTRPLPSFKAYGAFKIAFGLPEAALVLTDINQRTSLSGATPIIAMRPEHGG
ncbi:MAG: hypothetical protein KA098_04565 [Phenylobacterium sp.]|nr:hypothetical protein [Phenylobacterium sp.]